MTTSRLKEYKDNDFNEIIRRAEAIIVENKHFQEGNDKEDKEKDSLGKAMKAGDEANAKAAQNAYEKANKASKDASDAFDVAVGAEDQAKQAGETAGKAQQKADANRAGIEKNITDIDKTKQALGKTTAEVKQTTGKVNELDSQVKKVVSSQADTKQKIADLNNIAKETQQAMTDVQNELAAGKLDQAAAQAEIESLKNELQQIKDIMSDPNKLSGELTVTQDDITRGQSYLQKALTTGTFAQQIQQALPQLSKSFKGDTFNITKIIPLKSTNPSQAKYKVNFEIKTPAKNVQKVKMTASQDSSLINAYKFLEELSQITETTYAKPNNNLTANQQVIAGGAGTAAAKVAGAVQNIKNFGKQIGQNIKLGVQTANAPAAIEKEKGLEDYLPQALAQAFNQNITLGNKSFQVIIPSGSVKLKVEESMETLEEAYGVKGGSFTVVLNADDTPGVNNTQATPAVAQPPQQAAQPQQPQPAAQGQTNGNPSSNNVNIYNNGNPQQQGQQVRQGQQNSTPFWWDAASKKQQKKYVKNMMKQSKQANSGSNWWYNNTYGSQMGNSPTTATGWK